MSVSFCGGVVMLLTKRILVLVAWLSICAGAVTGQTQVVGLTDRSAGVATIEVNAGSCRARVCIGSGIGPRVAARAGGTAWDGRQGRAFVSNGTEISVVEVAPASAACRSVCVQAAPRPGPSASYVTGMTMLEGGRQPQPGTPGPLGQLFLAYSNQMLGIAEVRGCALGTPSYCDLSGILGTGRQVGGIAADDARGLLLIGTSSSVSTSPANVIFVAETGNPCVSLCRLAVTVNQTICAVRLGPITGLAYSACQQLLYITDGINLIYGRLQVTLNPASCRFVQTGCCAATGSEELTGLAVRPQAPVEVGTACTTAGCASCPGMTAAVVGDPVLGNGDFGIALRGAPAGYSTAILGVGFAPCGSTGINLGFCAPVRVALGPVPPLVLSFGNPAPGPGCGAQLTVPVSLPVQPGLCGVELSLQWILQCTGGGSGVSPCLSLVIE